MSRNVSAKAVYKAAVGDTFPTVGAAPPITWGLDWTVLPEIDGDKDIAFPVESVNRVIRALGAKAPTGVHVIRFAPGPFTLTFTESDLAVAQLLFPDVTVVAGKLSLAYSGAASPIALGIETDRGAIELRSVAPDYTSQMDMLAEDITQPTLNLIPMEDAEGEVGFYHYYTGS